jgi:hypothetical protein
LIFPYLRRGGLYIVEDWGWAHWPEDAWQKSEAIPAARPALSNLLFEVCLLSASRPDLVSSLQVNSRTFVGRKGDGEVAADNFNLSDHYLCRDRWFKPSM